MMRRFIYGATALVALFFVLLPASMALAQSADAMTLLKKLYGLESVPPITYKSVTVGTTPIKVENLDGGRIQSTIVNLSANNCYMLYDAGVSSTNGIELGPAGGNLLEDFRSDTILPTFEHWLVCSAAGSNVLVLTVNVQ